MPTHPTAALVAPASPGVVRRGPWSFVSLSWMNPVLRTGFRRPLQQEDLPDFNESISAAALDSTFDGFWAKLRAHQANPAAARPPSLAATLFSKFYGLFLAMMLLSAIQVGLAIQMPLMIPQVIAIVTPGADTSNVWIKNAYGTAALLFAMQVASSAVSVVSQSVLTHASVNVKAVLISAVYRKSLRLSPKESKKYSAGKISSLTTSDSARILSIATNVIDVVSNFSMLALGLYNMYRVIGLATVVAAGVYVVFASLQTLSFKYMRPGYVSYMRAGDRRTRILREFLYGIKFIKLQAIEDYIKDKLVEVRNVQLAGYRRFVTGFFYVYIAVAFQQRLVVPISIIAFSAFNYELTSSNVFTALGLFNALQQAASNVAGRFLALFTSKVSYNRISEFLLADEIETHEQSEMLPADASSESTAIKMSAASFTWEEVVNIDHDNEQPRQQVPPPQPSNRSEDQLTLTPSEESKPAPFALQDITLDIPRGSLVAVVGSVGSGKSSLLSALIGGMRKTAGDSALFGSVAYCAQEPWILTGTIEDNIVFGNDAVRDRIPAAVAAACLDRDLEILPNGLGTQIGEKGINLSGGQKARVALARAIARDADIYLLDDPIAALDAHVGKKVFDDAICGVLRGKTVVLVTHQLHLLPKVDTVVVLDEGRVVETGAFRELMAREDGALAEIMKDYHFDDAEAEAAKDAGDDADADGDKPEDIVKAVKAFEEEKAVEEDRRTVSRADAARGDCLCTDAERVVNQGRVSFSTIKSYFLSAGAWFPGMFLAVLLLSSAVTTFSRIFLDVWIDNKWGLSSTQYLDAYIGISAFNTVLLVLLYATVFGGCYLCAIVFHDRALDGLMRAPMSFFDGQPIGRVLNRMGEDVYAVDDDIYHVLCNAGEFAAEFVAAMVIVSYTSPYALIQFVAIMVVALLIFRFYQRSNIELKRLQSIMKSPLVAHVSETLNGIPTIRAFGARDIFVKKLHANIDLSNKITQIFSGGQYWISMRLNLIGATVTLVVGMLAAAGIVSATAVGLAIVSTISLGSNLNELLTMLSSGEAHFNSVERLNHYANDLPAEAARELPADPKDGAWPTAGAVAISSLEIRYPSRPDHAVIQDLSLDIQPREKVGVVGRTGSGKSTLMTALFRIMEASKGSIAIDGIDIASLGLKTLRSRLQIIPQDPVLFRGTVRSNLDFATKHADDELWAALDLVGLKDFVGTLDGKLDAAIEENGANLSMGQRQLMCLCKAILAKPKVLIMDEATASVDAEADRRIQESIETQFVATTVLSIAHRLNTIAAFDRVLVLDGGRIAEFDAPHVLLGRAGSVFGEMVEATGAANAAVIRQIAADHFAKTH
ncbi:hypothetical protein HK105_208812 [Polyrhizophydium stewartii]|uniref:P-loop containing nucleoside triphosphate hydrolase protein n=1 Tax=Polyrhizophydium stewartii TaxID=2732419 RepID=A0ABR4MWS2_9FUNG